MERWQKVTKNEHKIDPIPMRDDRENLKRKIQKTKGRARAECEAARAGSVFQLFHLLFGIFSLGDIFPTFGDVLGAIYT